MDTTKLAPHEALELREVLSSQINGAKKLKTNISMVNDTELKSFMQKCLNAKKGNIESIQQFLNNKIQIQ